MRPLASVHLSSEALLTHSGDSRSVWVQWAGLKMVSEKDIKLGRPASIDGHGEDKQNNSDLINRI